MDRERKLAQNKLAKRLQNICRGENCFFHIKLMNHTEK